MNGLRKRDVGKERRWREVLLQQERSGLTVRAFCHREGHSENSFHWWRSELARRDREQLPETELASDPQPARRAPPAFLPVKVSEPLARQERIEIVMPSGLQLRIAQEQLALVLEVLESRSC